MEQKLTIGYLMKMAVQDAADQQQGLITKEEQKAREDARQEEYRRQCQVNVSPAQKAYMDRVAKQGHNKAEKVAIGGVSVLGVLLIWTGCLGVSSLFSHKTPVDTVSTIKTETIEDKIAACRTTGRDFIVRSIGVSGVLAASDDEVAKSLSTIDQSCAKHYGQY